jgi:hypothetical protein
MNQTAKRTAGVVVALLLLVALVYGWRSYWNGRKLKQLQAKAAEIMSQPTPAGPPTGRRGPAGFSEIRDQVEALPASYQQQFRRSMGNMFQHRQEQRFDEYFKLSKAERRKYLDKEIAESEKDRKEREARRKQREAQTASGNTPGGPPSGGGGGPGNGGRNGWGGGRSQSARLDSTSPSFRAKMAEYRHDMNQRRAELGLPTNTRR